MGKISVLDCTLRDGGLGLEDAYKNNLLTTNGFSHTTILKIIEHFKKTDIDIIELGSIEENGKANEQFCIYDSVESVSTLIPDHDKTKQMYVALFRGPDIDLDKIPAYREGLVEGVRVIIRYSELEKSLKYCEALSQKGYKVFVQPMLTMRYTNDDLKMVFEYANRMNAYACYFVDSYGYMDEKDVEYYFKLYNKFLNPKIKIGFHAHNNICCAFSNAKFYANISFTSDRDVILDSCRIGLGQGSVNLQTELIIPFLNVFSNSYNFPEVLDICDIVENEILPVPLCGYSTSRVLSALHKAAYKYSVFFRQKQNLSYRDIDRIFEIMSPEEKNRFTKESAESILSDAKRRNII